jgi:hypothetical protein
VVDKVRVPMLRSVRLLIGPVTVLLKEGQGQVADSDLSEAVGPPRDVLVVGGGPAGTAAANTCASAGLDVALVGATELARNRKPGETVHPGVDCQLAGWMPMRLRHHSTTNRFRQPDSTT